jgi:hypothetical protein
LLRHINDKLKFGAEPTVSMPFDTEDLAKMVHYA